MVPRGLCSSERAIGSLWGSAGCRLPGLAPSACSRQPALCSRGRCRHVAHAYFQHLLMYVYNWIVLAAIIKHSEDCMCNACSCPGHDDIGRSAIPCRRTTCWFPAAALPGIHHLWRAAVEFLPAQRQHRGTLKEAPAWQFREAWACNKRSVRGSKCAPLQSFKHAISKMAFAVLRHTCKRYCSVLCCVQLRLSAAGG